MSKNTKDIPAKLNSQVEPAEPSWVEWVRSITIAIILALLIRWPVAEPYKIPSGSMEPTFVPGDRIFVDKHVYGVRYPINGFRVPFTRKNLWYADDFLWDGADVERWDIVVFKSIEPGAEFDTLVKRVVGMPGERIHIGDDGVIEVNGEDLELPDFMPPVYYTNPRIGGTYDSRGYGQLLDDEHSLIPDDHYLLLGDNSGYSRDGRWFGFMPKHHIIGRVTSIWWPIGRWTDFTGYTGRPWWSIMWAFIGIWTVWRLFYGRSWKARWDIAGGLIRKGEHVHIRYSLGVPIPFTGIKLTDGVAPVVGDLVFYHPHTAHHRHIDGLLGIVAGAGGDRVFFDGDSLYVNDDKVGGRFEELKFPKEGATDKFGRSKGKEFSEVPEGHVFILTQPGASDDDSRAIGWIPNTSVVGTVTKTWWPVTKVRNLKQVGGE